MDFPLPPHIFFVMGKVHVGLEKSSVHDGSILLSLINYISVFFFFLENDVCLKDDSRIYKRI